MQPKMHPEIHKDMIVRIAENVRISTIEMAKKLGVNKSTILRRLEAFRTERVVKRIGPAKGGYWKVLKGTRHDR